MTNTYIVAYDLNKEESSSDYYRLIKEIKLLGGWAKPLESTWLVTSNYTSGGIRDHLEQFIDGNDELLVINISAKGWATKGIDNKVTDWMENNI
jgi:hypothetical protein